MLALSFFACRFFGDDYSGITMKQSLDESHDQVKYKLLYFLSSQIRLFVTEGKLSMSKIKICTGDRPKQTFEEAKHQDLTTKVTNSWDWWPPSK